MRLGSDAQDTSSSALSESSFPRPQEMVRVLELYYNRVNSCLVCIGPRFDPDIHCPSRIDS